MPVVLTPITADTTFEEWKDKTNDLIAAVTNGSNEVDIATGASVEESAVAITIALG